MHVRLIALVAVAAVLPLGCGDGDASGYGSDARAAEEKQASVDTKEAERNAKAARRPRGAKLTVVDSEYGRVVADRKGEALYLFDKEDGRRSECYGACAAVWPPLLTKGKPVAAAGAKQGLLGTTRRRNGKLQVTYAGHPLYYYVDDSPGTILCHDVPEFGGTWLVVKPKGSPAA